MEKINAQKKVNAEAIRHYTLAYAEYNSLPYGYNTVVACIDKSTGICYDVLRNVFGFTSTSCQHINKFISDYSGARWRSEATVYTFREVEG